MSRLRRLLTGTTLGGLGAVLIAYGSYALALVQAQTAIEVAELSVVGWQFRGLRIAASSDAAEATAIVEVDRIESPDGLAFNHLRLTCTPLRLYSSGLDCLQGQLRLSGQQVARFSKLTLRQRNSHWSIAVDKAELNLAAIQEPLAGLFPGAMLASTAHFNLDIAGNTKGVARASVSLSAKGLNLSNADSTIASEGLRVTASAEIRNQGDHWAIGANGELQDGYGYINPILQDFNQHPARWQSKARWSPRGIELQSLHWKQQAVGSVEVSGRIQPGTQPSLRRLEIKLKDGQFPGLYSQALEPLLAGTALDQLSTGGGLEARLLIENDQPQSGWLQLDQVHIDDRQGRFAAYDLSGRLHWQAQGAAAESDLSWAGLYWGRIPFGPAHWRFVAQGDEFQNRQALNIGFFDGRIVIDQLAAKLQAGSTPQVLLQAHLEPVSLALLTSALGLPSFPGTLAGELPPAEYRDGRLALAGEITAEAFGGRLSIAGLEIDQPLGLVPRARGSIKLRNLDLLQVTSVFDVGRIEGRLDADVSALELQAWRPVAFKAELKTSPNDDGRHRISQRAINNISKVGGGGAVAALSSSFLRYFESFNYKRLGWSCELSKGVCKMGGVRASNDAGGYYIVEGRGLPRIDVIGHARNVSWDTLVTQLLAISSSPPPAIQ